MDKTIIPISQFLGEVLPRQWFDGTGDDDFAEVLNRIYVAPEESELEWTPEGLRSRHTVLIDGRPTFELPLLSGATLELGRPGATGFVEIVLGVRSEPLLQFEIIGLAVTLRLHSDVFQAVERVEGRWEVQTEQLALAWESDVVATPVGFVRLGDPGITINHDIMVGDTGIVITFRDTDGSPISDPSGELVTEPFHLVVGEVPSDIDGPIHNDFRGLYIPYGKVIFYKPGTRLPDLELRQGALGLGGFHGDIGFVRPGTIAEDSLDSLEAHELAGFRIVLESASINFEQSLPTTGSLSGYAFIPLAERWRRFEATLGGPTGDVSFELAGVNGEGLIELNRTWIEIQVQNIEYSLEDGVHWAVIDGAIRPKIPGFDWPSMQVEGLRVSSEGDVDIPGGWLTLPESKAFNFGAFTIELSELGLGTEPGDGGEHRWMGFSGGINLVEGLPLSTSVEGLKFSWPKDGDVGEREVSLEGIAIELEIPQVLKLKGSVAYEAVTADTAGDGEPAGHVFRGHVHLTLHALNGTEVEGQLMIGKLGDFTTFYVSAEAMLPFGIILGSSGMAIYGLAGLFGRHVAPARADDTPWYDWYRSTPAPYSVNDVAKWAPERGEHAFGAGLMLATAFDDGRTVDVNALVVVLTPGPVVMIEGFANVLAGRPNDLTEEGAFHALAVIDGRAGTFQLNIDASYNLKKIIELGGAFEAFFDFNDSSNWHVYIGQETPEEKRIRAEILALFGAQSYLMIEPTGIITGAKAGWDLRKKFGPIKIYLVAILEYHAEIFWEPAQLEGRLNVEGELGIEVFGIGLALILQMLLEGKAPDPYWVHGLAKIKIKLPWPLPDPTLKLEFTWESGHIPEAVAFLKETNFVHHKLADGSWATTIERLLEDGSAEDMAAVFDKEDSPAPSDAATGDLDSLRLVPVDARPLLSLGRPWDWLMNAGVDEVEQWTFKYGVMRIQLERRDTDGEDVRYTVVKEFPEGGDIIPEGFEWIDLDPEQAVKPSLDAHDPKIELWRYGALDSEPLRRRETHSDRSEACPPPPHAPWRCLDWEEVPIEKEFPPEFSTRAGPYIVTPGRAYVDRVGGRKALSSPLPLYVKFPEPVGRVTVEVVVDDQAVWDTAGISVAAFSEGIRVEDLAVASERGATRLYELELADSTDGVDTIKIDRVPGRVAQLREVCLAAVCYKTTREREREDLHTPPDADSPAPPSPFSSTLELEPNTTYRLNVAARTQIVRGDSTGLRNRWAVRSYHFHTGTGPRAFRKRPGQSGENGRWHSGYDDRLLPDWVTMAEEFGTSPLNRLETYLARTVPKNGAKRFYYGYDVGVEFNQSYVAQMYPECERLVIRLRDRNGRRLSETTCRWQNWVVPILEPGLRTWAAQKEREGCLNEAEGSVPRTPTLSCGVAPDEIRPEKLYTAEVVLESGGVEVGALYSFQFATSRYRDIKDHLTAGGSRTELPVRNVGTVSSEDEADLRSSDPDERRVEAGRRDLEDALGDALSEMSVYDVPEAARAADEIRRALADLDLHDRETFDQLYDDLGFAGEYRPLPPATELAAVRSDGTGRYALLLESPEPLEWERITLTVEGHRVRVVANRDQTRAFLISRDHGWFATGNHDFEFHYRGDLPELPPISETPEDGAARNYVDTAVVLSAQLG